MQGKPSELHEKTYIKRVKLVQVASGARVGSTVSNGGHAGIIGCGSFGCATWKENDAEACEGKCISWWADRV